MVELGMILAKGHAGRRGALAARALGGRVHGGARESVGPESAFYVKPALVEMPEQAGPVLRETFAPILYVMKYSEFDDVLETHNAVGGGLSSSIFTTPFSWSSICSA